MPYSNIPGVKAAYNDKGALGTTTRSTQPNILILGPAEKGVTLSRFNVVQTSLAEAEFGSASPLLRMVHECLRQGSDNISVMRTGGFPGQVAITDSANKALYINTVYSDDEILSRYALQVTTTVDGDNRYVIYDRSKRQYVYDSLGVLVLDTGEVYITDEGWAVGATINASETIPSLWITLQDLVIGDIDVGAASVTIDTLEIMSGNDGLDDSLVERYASMVNAYYQLDYKAADFLLPTDVYIDDNNIVDVPDAEMAKSGAPASATDYGLFWAGVPDAGAANDMLGYLWQFEFRSHFYVGFADQLDIDTYAAVAASYTGADALTITVAQEGKGGNACTIEVVDDPGADATITYNEDGGLDIYVRADITGGDDSAAVAGYINAAVSAWVAPAGFSPRKLTPVELLGATPAAGDVTPAVAVPKTNLTGGEGGAFILITDNPYLPIPADVATKVSELTAAQLRECNFAQQLAEACYLASTNWSTMQGVISFKEPDRTLATSPASRAYTPISEWVGNLPRYSDNGSEQYIDSVADNGYGILGSKLLAGAYGYRGEQLQFEPATDGYAFGGIIRTVGAALPNGELWPYGIDDADEALDQSGRPVDLGKHIYMTYDWPLHSNGFNGGSTYYGSLVCVFAGKLAITPDAEEPIGQNGRVVGVSNPLNIHSTQISSLASIRAIGLREDDGVGLILTSAKTAAHPSSDFTRCSTVRAVNRMITGIRNLANPYIGKQFTPQTLLSLKGSIDQLIVAERQAGIHNGAKCRFYYTRADQIRGNLTIRLAMVPPYTLETILVEVSLAADEADLNS